MANLVTRTNGTRSPLTALFGFDPFAGYANGTNPSHLDVSRTETGYTIELPVPGFAPAQIDVTIEDRLLTVKGQSERRSFTRTLLVPEEIDADKITAHVENGMLTLTLGLIEKAQPKKIAVQVSSSN